MPNDATTKGACRARAVIALLAAVCAGCARGESAPDAAHFHDRGDGPALAVAYDSSPSLREILQSRAFVGRRVRLTGRCLDKPQTLDRPLRLNQWQLEADGVAAFVIGVVPSQCSSPRDSTVLAVTAVVAEDTLPAIGDLPPAPRRYLVLINAEAQ